MSRVLPGVDEVMASFGFFVSILMRLDLPTLERPMKAYSGISDFGHISALELLIVNSALFISIYVYEFLSFKFLSLLIVFCNDTNALSCLYLMLQVP